ncbi:MAG: acyl-CoA/acyl-ACP dehydrogenase [Ectothiorhodospiraceae bacterium]|nr:acyl-CoA/acyl-ACP dehydrogenase [Chromatiales bacterium]MCP5154424.1 acyl-CoA/acyl-ACP dehydrogenase [Ectothiorhodospiraceae bacterium]
MDFSPTDEHRAIDESVRRIMARFPDDYWLACDREARFPHEFRTAMAEGGWLGIAMPSEHGGSGLGVLDAAVMMHAVADSPGAMSAASAIHINIFGPHAITVFGTPDQCARWIPPLVAGREIACFGVTEPDAGLDTTRITTTARRAGDHYVVDGRKVWTSTAKVADKIMLLARTRPLGEGRPADGLSLFYTDLDRARIEVREIPKMGRAAVDSNALFIDGLEVPVTDRIGEEGQGFRYLLHSLNPERVLIAAEAVGIGRHALGRAAGYARERVVFGRPIGQNQSIQHPLARCWMELEAAWLATLRAGWAYDRGLPSGVEANTAKYLAGEAAYRACERALMTHGGMGYAREYHVERLWREVLIPRIAPVSPEMILCYIAERALGLPRSY